ncbi:MAG: hypothetical protein J6J35_04875 [Alphaproteobacteria bacterium]|nr:hypothetical protein [Alphaproteobacteria bacterium]
MNKIKEIWKWAKLAIWAIVAIVYLGWLISLIPLSTIIKIVSWTLGIVIFIFMVVMFGNDDTTARRP